MLLTAMLASVSFVAHADDFPEASKMECKMGDVVVKCPESEPPKMECRIGGVLVRCPEPATPPSTVTDAPQESSEARTYRKFMEELKPTLAQTFKDPNSVQWRNVYVIRGMDNRLGLCGEVNGKNSYGAYVGFKRFVASSKGDIITDGNRKCTIFGCFADDFNASTIDKAYSSICNNRVYP